MDVTLPAFDCAMSDEALSATRDASLRSAQLAHVAPHARLDALARGAGWELSRTLDSVAHHVVALVKA